MIPLVKSPFRNTGHQRVFKLLFLLSMVMTVLSGCSLHAPASPDHRVEIPETYKAPVSETVMENERWWLVFKDSTLNDLMEAAFRDNADLDAAYARFSQAEALTRKNRAFLLPSFNLSANTERASRLGGSDTITGDAYALSFSAGYEVDLWNRLDSAAKASEFTKAASIEDIRTLYLSISARVADLYFLMVELRAQLILADHTIAARKETVELVEERFRLGTVPALDLYQARQNLATARSLRPDFESRLATSGHAISILTGGYPNREIGGDLSELPRLSTSFPAGLPSELLKKRPDIAGLLARLSAADLEIAVAAADRFPSVNLLAGFGPAGSDVGTALSGIAWNFAADLMLPLFDGGRRKAEVDRSRAFYEELLAEYRKSVLTAFGEVEDALVKERKTTDRILLLEIEEKEASHALRLAGDRYFDGLSDYLPVLTAQNAHYSIRSRLLSARRELTSNRISLARATGGTWPASNVRDRLPSHGENDASQG